MSKISKIFEIFSQSSYNFFHFQNFSLIFFIDRCKILLRSECTYLESPENELERASQQIRTKPQKMSFFDTLTPQGHQLQNQTHVYTVM